MSRVGTVLRLQPPDRATSKLGAIPTVWFLGLLPLPAVVHASTTSERPPPRQTHSVHLMMEELRGDPFSGRVAYVPDTTIIRGAGLSTSSIFLSEPWDASMTVSRPVLDSRGLPFPGRPLVRRRPKSQGLRAPYLSARLSCSCIRTRQEARDKRHPSRHVLERVGPPPQHDLLTSIYCHRFTPR